MCLMIVIGFWLAIYVSHGAELYLNIIMDLGLLILDDDGKEK